VARELRRGPPPYPVGSLAGRLRVLATGLNRARSTRRDHEHAELRHQCTAIDAAGEMPGAARAFAVPMTSVDASLTVTGCRPDIAGKEAGLAPGRTTLVT
jgi:hypothetical protein